MGVVDTGPANAFDCARCGLFIAQVIGPVCAEAGLSQLAIERP